MKYIFLLFASMVCNILYTYATGQVNKNDSALSSFIKKYGLQNNPIILITINPEQNPAYIANFRFLHDSINKYNVNKNVVYLFRLLRPSETQYFFAHNMNFSPTKEEVVIADEEFYEKINSSTMSTVFLIYNNSIIQQAPAVNAFSAIKIKIKYSVQNVLMDSVKMDESKIPVSNRGRFIIDNEKLVLMDSRYNNINIYNVKTGIMEDHLDVKYDYEGMYAKYISSDTAKINFSKRTRRLTSQTFNMSEFSIDNILLIDSSLFIPCSITYSELNKNHDTAITRYMFLLKTDMRLKKHAFYYMPYPEQFNVSPEYVFIAENDTTFVYSIFPSGKKEIQGNKLLARFSLRNGKIVYKNMPDLQLPDYFLKKGIGYRYQGADFYKLNGKNFIYFILALPNSYSTDNGKIISYPDTLYKDPASWNDESKTLITFYVHPLKENLLAYFTNENGKSYFSILKTDENTLICKEPIADRFSGARVAASKKSVYLIKPNKNDMYLYHFEIK